MLLGGALLWLLLSEEKPKGFAGYKRKGADRKVPPEVRAAFKAALKTNGLVKKTTDSWCLEIVESMTDYLKDHGYDARPQRRDMGAQGGHWTLKHDGVEYDPTIEDWDRKKPTGKIHVVSPVSPHHKWDIDEGA